MPNTKTAMKIFKDLLTLRRWHGWGRREEDFMGVA